MGRRKGLCGRGCGDGLWGWVVGSGGEKRRGEAAGAAATPAAFNIGLCRLRGSYPPPAAAKTIHYSLNDNAAGGPFPTAATTMLQAGHYLPPRRWCCRRAVPNCRNDGAAGGPFSTAATMVLQAGLSLPPRRWCCRRAFL